MSFSIDDSNVTMLDISAESAGTTSSNLNTTNPPFVANTGSWMNSTQQEISQALEIYVTPAVFVLGIVGNILALAVFSQKEFRNSLSSWLFRLLALVDSFALIMHDGMHVVPHLLGTSFLTYNTATCKVFMPLYFYFRALGGWILVIVGLERVIGVWVPHKAKIICTHKHFAIIAVTASSILLVLYSPLFSSVGHITVDLGNGMMHTGCSASAGNPDLLWYTTTFYPYMNLAMSCLMPFVLILVMNTIIGVLLCGRMRSTTNSSQTTTIAMLQAVSIAFLILTIPYPVYFICGLLYQDGLKINFNNILMAGVVAATCDSINHSINILLYSICGRRFRMVAARIITCGCHREGHKDERKSSQPTSNTTQETGVSNQI